MAILGLKPWVKPFGKMSIFRLFKLLVFMAQKGVFFFVLEYHRIHFPGLYCLKKKLEKWPFLDQNKGLTPLEKCYFFDFLNFLFNVEYRIQNIEHSSQNTFPQSILRKKKKVGKMAICGPKPWVNPLWKNVNFWTLSTSCFFSLERRVNPFGKMSIFRLFVLVVFIAQKGVLTFQNIIKDIFFVYVG